MSGKLAARATAAWADAGLERITLHECRHTYASLLMAAGYTLKDLMELMGHADLQMVNATSCASHSPARPTRPSASTTTCAGSGARNICDTHRVTLVLHS
jgi:integrase